MTTTQMPPSSCPSCGYRLEAATSVAGSFVPCPGDLSFCFSCGALNQFAEDLTVRIPSPEALAKLEALPEIAKLRAAWRRLPDVPLAGHPRSPR